MYERISAGIPTHIRRQLEKDKAEIVGGVIAGSTTFIGIYEFMIVSGIPPSSILLIAAEFAAAAAATSVTAIHETKRELRYRRNK